MHQTHLRPWPKTFIGGLVSDACTWLGPPWLNLGFSLALSVNRKPWRKKVSTDNCLF